jgi:hypothetical protein
MSIAKPTTNEEMRDFTLTLAEQCSDHTQWLAFVRYGLGFLLDNQSLLIEVITTEAARLTDKAGASGSTVEETRRIFDELGLKLVVASDSGAVQQTKGK